MDDNAIREPEPPAQAGLRAVKRKAVQSPSPVRKHRRASEAQASKRCWEHERREYS